MAETDDAPAAGGEGEYKPRMADTPCPKCGAKELTGLSYERGEAGILDKGPVKRDYLRASCANCGYRRESKPTLDFQEGGHKAGGFSASRRAARQKKRRPK